MSRFHRSHALPVLPYNGRDLASLARDHTETALNKLVGFMKNGKTEAVQAQCAQYILDRGWGRVPTAPTDSSAGPVTVEIVYRQRDTTEPDRPLIDVTPGASPVLPNADSEHN
jgi:hypothetical protein